MKYFLVWRRNIFLLICKHDKENVQYPWNINNYTMYINIPFDISNYHRSDCAKRSFRCRWTMN